MRILVTGAGGLVGRALVARGALGLSRAQLDVTDDAALAGALASLRPEAVIFCAALADVDGCARDPGARAVNVLAPARCAARVPTWLVSSNYVFDGPGPHAVAAPRRPVNAYGRMKVEAEDAVLAAGGHVVRTGWVYGPGGRNFPSRIAALLRGASPRRPVRALAGWPVQPTWVGDLAEHLLALPRGISHAAGREETTWLDFALSAQRLLGLSDRVVATEHLPTGPRPSDARLAGAQLPGWSERLPLHLR